MVPTESECFVTNVPQTDRKPDFDNGKSEQKPNK